MLVCLLFIGLPAIGLENGPGRQPFFEDPQPVPGAADSGGLSDQEGRGSAREKETPKGVSGGIDASSMGISFEFVEAKTVDIIKNVAKGQKVNALVPTRFSSKTTSLKMVNSTLAEVFAKVAAIEAIAVMRKGDTFLFAKPETLQRIPSESVFKDLETGGSQSKNTRATEDNSADFVDPDKPVTSPAEVSPGINISLDFRNADIRDLIRIIALKSGRNIVCMKHVRGSLSLRVTNQPWPEVLRYAAGIMGYDCRLQGKTIFIAPNADMESFVPKLPPVQALAPKIAIAFRDTDIRDIFSTIAHRFAADLIVEKAVRGNVTINLADVGEEEAMMIVARGNGFRCEKVGRTWYVIGSRVNFDCQKELGHIGPFSDSTPVSLEFRDANIRDIFRIIAQKGQLELKMAEEIRGNITVRITDRPALEIIQCLSTLHGYDVTVEGNRVGINGNPDVTASSEEPSPSIPESVEQDPPMNEQETTLPTNNVGRPSPPLPPPPEFRISVMGIAGDDNNRLATILFQDVVYEVSKGDCVNGLFEVREIFPDKIVVFSIAKKTIRTFPLHGR
jgi:hypothetical protein